MLSKASDPHAHTLTLMDGPIGCRSTFLRILRVCLHRVSPSRSAALATEKTRIHQSCVATWPNASARWGSDMDS